MKLEWYQQSTRQALEKLDSSPTGLTEAEAKKRLVKYGENTLPEAKPVPLWLIFLRQFESSLIYVLFAAAVVIYLLHGLSDALIIGVVLLFNAVVGAIQEGRAQNTLRALKNFLETKATVYRDGEKIIVSDRLLVPGDVIWLQEGEKVPADARVLQSHNLRVSEAALTGESTPIHKVASELHHKTALADQKNMVFKGALVLGGNGTALVTSTGLRTEVGSISASLKEKEGEMPLKEDITALSELIMKAIGAFSLLLLVVGLLKGYALRDMFSTVISLAVSVIPEGLPVVLTLILSTGVWRMSKRNALVKKLQAVEGLGQVDVIAVDKTGTITQNQMTLTHLYISRQLYEVSGTGYEPTGGLLLEGKEVKEIHRDIERAAHIAAYCATAQLSFDSDSKEWQVTGDPTEAAMQVFAAKLGVAKEALLREFPVMEEQPFDYRTKIHVLLSEYHNHHQLLSACGAPEAILDLCKISPEEKAHAEEALEELSANGLRVVAFAYKKGKLDKIKNHLNHLEFGGFFAMRDPLHEEVPGTVRKVQAAGIRVVLITGDHSTTARAIAQSAHIYHAKDIIISGKELELMSTEELRDKLLNVSVFCRVTPEQKMQIIAAYQALGKRIAMTGDGVNDAPSLVAADLGVSMGKVGTEVAKEASDIVLLDDNFKSIVAAIEEGRSIYATIRKAISYLFTTGVAEVVAIAGSILLGLPLMLQASQIIWLNFVTDGFLTAALAMEPQEGDILKEPHQKRQIIDREMAGRMIWIGSLMAVGSLLLFANFHEVNLVKASTLAMVSLASVQWVYAWNVRSRYSIWQGVKRPASPYLLAATVLIIFLQIAAVHLPFLQKALYTTPLTLSEWLLASLPAGLIYLLEEGRKHFVQIRSHSNSRRK